MRLEHIVDTGLVPELVLRPAIRAVCAQRLWQARQPSAEAEEAAHQRFVDELRASPVAIETAAANQQHYEVPAEFFTAVLGPHLKYSGCYWPDGVTDLGAAEAAMLELSAQRAHLADGQEVLDLGCGWGSFSLWAAARYPASRIVGVSNSSSQRAFIEARAAQRGLTNLRIVTGDVRTLELDQQFDRVVSIEMFEHMRNYRVLLAKIASWLRPSGELFVHVFAHRRYAYPYEDRGGSDWMARQFFTGGLMPSTRLLLHFQDHLRVAESWQVSGRHYARTAEAWHHNLLAHRRAAEGALAVAYGADYKKQFHRWRVFFLACAEMFGYRGGREWVVAHYRFAR